MLFCFRPDANKLIKRMPELPFDARQRNAKVRRRTNEYENKRKRSDSRAERKVEKKAERQRRIYEMLVDVISRYTRYLCLGTHVYLPVLLDY